MQRGSSSAISLSHVSGTWMYAHNHLVLSLQKAIGCFYVEHSHCCFKICFFYSLKFQFVKLAFFFFFPDIAKQFQRARAITELKLVAWDLINIFPLEDLVFAEGL